MNSLRPTGFPRATCLPRTTFQPWLELESLVARLAPRTIRPYSSSPVRRKDSFRTCVGALQIPQPRSRFQTVRFFASRRILTRYEQLRKNYRLGDELPYRIKPVSDAEAKQIFGNDMNRESADEILRRLHGQRVSGTLPDPDAPNVGTVVSQRLERQGLAWLRKNVPVDEDHNAALNATEELQRVQAELLDDSQRIGIWAPNSGLKKGESVYGEGIIDRAIKARKKQAAQAAAQKLLTQAEEVKENTGTVEMFTSRVELRTRQPSEMLKYYTERATVAPEKVPVMSSFARIWPSAICSVAIVIAAILFAAYYTPPGRSGRIWPDTPPALACVSALILANTFVFVLWHFPPAWRVLNKYFVVLPGYPRALSVLGNFFSHQKFAHLAANMIVLFVVGTRLHDQIGRGNFLALYFSAGVTAALVSLSSWVLAGSFISSSVGASGAICGLMACWLWLEPGESVQFLGLFPPKDWWLQVPSGLLLALFVSADVVGLRGFPHRKVYIDHWGHIGGYMTGMVGAQMLRKQYRERATFEKERREKMQLLRSN